MKIYRDNRHLELLNQASDGGLPLEVAYMQSSVDFRDCPGREETERVAILYMCHSTAYSLHGYCSFLRVIGLDRVDGDEGVSHCRDMIEKHIYHNLVILTIFPYDMKQEDTIHPSEGMIADGYEWPCLQVCKGFLIIYPKLKFEFIF